MSTDREKLTVTAPSLVVGKALRGEDWALTVAVGWLFNQARDQAASNWSASAEQSGIPFSMAAKQARRFVVVSGLPGSGKTSLARRLSPLLNLPVIDKDDILEDLFAARGMGDVAWRRELSRESDLLFRAAAEDSSGGILVSFWHLTGMPLDSGTPTNWLASLSSQIVHLHCECPPAIAAERYSQRRRHSGHLDHLKSRDEILQTIERVADCEPFQIGTRVNCDTSSEVDFTLLMARISEAFRKP